MRSIVFLLVLCLFVTSVYAGSHMHDHKMHEHELYEITDLDNVPSVEIEIIEDPKSGWNIHIITSNFEFKPESASLENIEGEGHAHVHINGEKVNRVYGEWYHIPELENRENEILVTLSTNDHKDYSVNGEIIEDRTIVVHDGQEMKMVDENPSFKWWKFSIVGVIIGFVLGLLFKRK